jgi:hypothetical protein
MPVEQVTLEKKKTPPPARGGAAAPYGIVGAVSLPDDVVSLLGDAGVVDVSFPERTPDVSLPGGNGVDDVAVSFSGGTVAVALL